MAKRSRIITALLCASGMVILILDSKTALYGAAEGIDICLRTVIPSLLPFFVLSILLTNAVSGANTSFLSPLGRLCGIPKGAETLLLIGLLGGYPVGAQSVAEAYRSGYLTKKDAHRLLGFCNNAGPAFIFGITGSLLSSRTMALLLWGIHIASALIVGIILPGRSDGQCSTGIARSVTLPEALSRGSRIMASVCGWIILFRTLIAFLDRWFLWLLPETLRLLLIGLLELANGCHSLLETQSEAVRFIISAVILGFGGICVSMQTVSATEELGTGWYFPGKLLQAALSQLLSIAVILCQSNTLEIKLYLIAFAVSAVIVSIIILTICKKTVAFPDNLVYNN